jgi:tyrosine-protein phosphatase SIW14
MRTLLHLTLAGLIASLMIACPILYKRSRDRESPNFHVVEEGVLYRSGQLAIAPLQRLVANHGIRTIICLRDRHDVPEMEEEGWSQAKGLNFIRIPPRKWYPDAAGNVPAEASVKTFRAVMDDPANYPVLVHCFAGIHRTGTMCAIFRMDYQGWSKEDAMAEMRIFGYSLLDDHEDVHDYFMNYSPPTKSRSARALTVPVKRQKIEHP